ncbi:MAG TPA: hypothetical protein VIX14_08480 [Terriglobales bacterium]
MFVLKRDFLCAWLLSVFFLFAVSAGAQITPRDDAHPSTSVGSTSYGASGELDLQSIPQGPQGPTLTNGNVLNYRNAFDPTPCCAVNDVVVHDNVKGEDFMSGVIKKEATKVGADPSPTVNNRPPAMTVQTAALLELHAMRQSAVGLCIQLPAKYRKHLPQCADIFKHEIRLQALAKHSQ